MAAVGTLEPWSLVTALAKVSIAARMVAGLAVSLGSFLPYAKVPD